MHFTTNVIYLLYNNNSFKSRLLQISSSNVSCLPPPPIQNFLFPIPRTPNYKQRIACFDLKKSDSTWVFSPQITTYWKQNIFSHYIICSLLSGQFWVIWFIKYCYARFLYIFWQTYVLFWSINKNIDKPS